RVAAGASGPSRGDRSVVRLTSGLGGHDARGAGTRGSLAGSAGGLRWPAGQGSDHLPALGAENLGQGDARSPQRGAIRMTTMTIEVPVSFQPVGRCGRKGLPSATDKPTLPPGRVPRVARLMALALRLHELVRTGQVANYSTLASLGQVTRARISQIASLLHLAPDIQEAILFLPPTLRGRD